MKKILAFLAALCLFIPSAAPAQESAFTLRSGVSFGMSMDDVIASEPVRYHEIDLEHTLGGVSFAVLEYENVPEDNATADLEYLFAEDVLVALRVSYDAAGIDVGELRDDLTAKYGPGSALDPNVLGDGIYALDDDGVPEGRTESWTCGSVMIVLEIDGDDIDLTYLDLSAAYIG